VPLNENRRPRDVDQERRQKTLYRTHRERYAYLTPAVGSQ